MLGPFIIGTAASGEANIASLLLLLMALSLFLIRQPVMVLVKVLTRRRHRRDTAPAAYWVSGGNDNILAGILWALSWLQSSASIVNVYLRLEQRQLKTLPSFSARLQMGRRTAAYHLFNLALVCVLASQTLIPLLIITAFGLMLIDALEGTLRPVIGVKSSMIGLRQLVSSSIFVVLTSYAFRFTT